MNSDIVRAHGMTVDISEQDLIEIELMIQKSRLDRHSEKVNSVQHEGNSVIANGVRYCLASKRNDPAPEAFDPPPGIMVDALMQEFAGERYLIKPFSHRAVLWFDRHLAHHRTKNGYMFGSKRELGLTSSANFSYRMIDSDGYPL